MEYICENYHKTCFDLWEEINGHHFYTLMMQKKALIMGSVLAKEFNDMGAHSHYLNVVDDIDIMLQKFYGSDFRIISSMNIDNQNTFTKREYDMSILLAYIHAEQPFDHYLVNTVVDMIDLFKNEFEVNRKNMLPVQNDFYCNMLMGRYPGDVYYGGNPWILTTAALVYFLCNIDFNQIELNHLDHEVFSVLNLNHSSSNNENNNICRQTGTNLMKYLLSIEKHNINNINDSEFDSNNKRFRSFSEQIHRDDLSYLSADELTWNYVEILRALIMIDV